MTPYSSKLECNANRNVIILVSFCKYNTIHTHRNMHDVWKRKTKAQTKDDLKKICVQVPRARLFRTVYFDIRDGYR